MDILIDMVLNGPWGDKLLVLVPAAISIANVITMLSPSVSESKVYNIIMKILNVVSLNIVKNKNADAE